MHADELPIDESLVRRLLAEQFPQWAELPLAGVEPSGTVNAIYRIGDNLAIRLPRLPEWSDEGFESEWLPRLAPLLPLEVPTGVARGVPGAGYPCHWSVVTWIEGANAIEQPLTDEGRVADVLAAFLGALQRADSTDAPGPGYGRGKPLAWRDDAVRDALERVDPPGALELWEQALRAPEWSGDPVWLHADLDARNVLVRDGRLAAVVDWGGAGIGDPAVDVMAAWKFLTVATRDRFRAALEVDDATWLRAQGWTVSQALIALGYYTLETNAVLVREAQSWLAEVLSDRE